MSINCALVGFLNVKYSHAVYGTYNVTISRSRNIYTSSAWYFTQNRWCYGVLISPATLQTCIGLHVNCPILMPDLNCLIEFSWKFPVTNSTEIRTMSAVLIHSARPTAWYHLIRRQRFSGNFMLPEYNVLRS